jgi:hypothetical protein
LAKELSDETRVSLSVISNLKLFASPLLWLVVKSNEYDYSLGNKPILPLYAFPSRSLGTRQKGSVSFILICCLLPSIFEITDKLTLVSSLNSFAKKQIV